MWLLTLALPALVLVVAGLILGGAYTIVLLPIAAIIVLVGGGYVFLHASRHPETIPGEREPIRPVPHTEHRNTPGGPSTPDQLVDARRAQQ